MTTTIYATVYRDEPDEGRANPWNASVMAVEHGGRATRGRFAWTHSWPEAMQAAYKLRAEIEAELMDEVHASRASRRAPRVPEPVECPHGRLLICHDCQDEHTMEATA